MLSAVFLKGNVGTLRFAVNDVFNENTGYTTTQSGSYTTQVNANRLGRYFMLSFVLRLQKFAGAKPSGPGMGGPVDLAVVALAARHQCNAYLIGSIYIRMGASASGPHF